MQRVVTHGTRKFNGSDSKTITELSLPLIDDVIDTCNVIPLIGSLKRIT